MINKELDQQTKSDMQSILKDFPENFNGLGKLKNHQVKLHVDEKVKPVNVPQRPIPYHLRERAQKAIDTMIEEDVIEKHPENMPAPWISCAVIASKPNGDTRCFFYKKHWKVNQPECFLIFSDFQP